MSEATTGTAGMAAAQPLNELRGKVAIVTGASSGIGEAVAELLAQRGARVALAARRTDKLEALGERLAQSASDTETMVVYLSDKVEVDIVWGWSSALVGVRFIDLLIPQMSPQDQPPFGESKEQPRVIRLHDLAAMRGYADDPDFLLGDSDQFGGRITTKRFKLLQRDLAGVLDGLARVTDRYASDLLRGDLSIYPQVRTYYLEKRRAQGYW